MDLQKLIDGLKAHRNGAAAYESVDEAIRVFEAMRDVDGEKVCKGLECCALRDPDDHRRCGECPYNPHAISNEPCANGLKFNALSLIRQQQERIKELEAGQTARVMTLEEVKDNEVVYLEDFTEPDDCVEPIIRPAINIEAKNGGIVMLDSATWDEGFIFVVDSDYCKTWRCWTQRPSDTERSNTPWGK